MGSTSSVIEAQGKIGTLHGTIGAIYKRIDQKGRWIIAEIEKRQYTNKDAICSKVLWTNYDELAAFFPITTLNGIRYKAGVKAVDTPALQQSKLQTCMAIERLYLRKISLINNILQELPKCAQMEYAVYKNLEAKLKVEPTNTERWLSIYQQLESFNKDIKNRYELIEKQLESIRVARTDTQINGVSGTTNAILADTTKICRNYENRLIQISSAVPVLVTSPLPVTRPLRVPLQAELVQQEVLVAPVSSL